MKIVRRILKIAGWMLVILVAYVTAVLIHGTYTDYQPEETLPLQPAQTAIPSVIEDSILSFAIWNVGYGGLGEESDFFYDHGSMLFSGGRMIHSPEEMVDKNMAGIRQFAASTKSDFFLLQEVDSSSRRSYYIDQFNMIAAELPDYSAYFAVNYHSPRVPIPLFEPWRAYGKAYSGLATYSRFQPTSSVRYQLPGAFAWPTRIFQLDRCVSAHRFAVKGGKELLLLNVHNSAYDTGGELKARQMAYLRDLVLAEYEKGNYVIVGGDWNQCPPFFRFDGFMPGRTQGYTQLNIAADFLPPDWQWIYDPTAPTNRKIRTAYEPGETFITLIDFFLISPNVRALEVKTIDQEFRFSDHQPVWMQVELL